MAPLSARNRSFLRRQQQQERPVRHRALTAAAVPIKLDDRSEARKARVLRQGWQLDASSYTDSIPELSFAYRFLAHASSRMRYFPAYVNPEAPDGPPVHIDELPSLPEAIRDSMKAAMAALGQGRMALSPMQSAMSYNFGITGEALLLGREDAPDGETWSVRSIEEVQIFDDVWKFRDVPLDPQGVLGWQDLPSETTYLSRMWVPHWRFRMLATSPMRSLLDVCEELMLLSRDVRAVSRSRLAGGGILKVPEGLRMFGTGEDDEDPESEDWFGRFAEAMMEPLADEGTASSVVPIALSGDIEDLKALEHLIIDRPYSALAMELRAEAIGRIATGVDVPREILEGISDPNHWGSWLVSDDSFRHHIEPQVITQVDAMSVAYMRVWLKAAGFPPAIYNRACIWYDPVDLISKPDPMGNAVPLHDRLAISDATLRKAGGYTEEDAPSRVERYLRMVSHMRTFPPNVLEAIIHAGDPGLEIPPIQQSGQVPGMGPTGAIEPPVGPPPTAPTGAGATAELPSGPTPAETGPPGGMAALTETAGVEPAEPMSFAADPSTPEPDRPDRAAFVRASRRLAEMDAQLRARIQVAASGAMMRLLDRAGAKLRTRMSERRYREQAAEAQRRVEGLTNRQVAAELGPPLVAALGYASSLELLNPDWGELRGQFHSWVDATQAQALKIACQMAGLAGDDPRVQQAEARMAGSVTAAWEGFEQALNAIAERLLYRPEPGTPEQVTVDPSTVVPQGIIRAALRVAGGAQPLPVTADAGQQEVLDPEQTVAVDEPAVPSDSPPAAMASVDVGGQIGTGDAISDLLAESDNVDVGGYEWVHGVSYHPLPSHEALDGVAFSSFDDEALANPDEFPENEFLFPGDHDGCGCDWFTTWVPVETAAEVGDGADFDGSDQGTAGLGTAEIEAGLEEDRTQPPELSPDDSTPGQVPRRRRKKGN